MASDIYIIDDSKKILHMLKDIFTDHMEFKFKSIQTKNIDSALRNIPELIIIYEDGNDYDVTEICKSIREDEDNSITPILVISSKKDKRHIVNVLKEAVEYYITEPINERILYYTIKNISRLMYVNRGVSPLTGLPGNVQIQAEIKKRLLNQTDFAVLYFDLDNFKAYNDYYGFLKGDEVLKFTGRTIWECCAELEEENNFVGHVGGDDFVAIVNQNGAEKVCQDIIAMFDIGILRYFNKEEIEKGYIEISNRKGVIEEFPLVCLSIGVVNIESDRIINMLEIGEIGAQVKHAAKSINGSTYVINKRKDGE